MLRLHFLLLLIIALGYCQDPKPPGSPVPHYRENMEKMGKLIARWNRIEHPIEYSPVPEKDKAFIRKYLDHNETDHVPSIPEINGDDAAKLIEGDIIPSDEDIAEMEERLREQESGISSDLNRAKRAASNREAKDWPTNAPIPYIIENGFSEEQVEIIHAGLKTFGPNTCVKFEENRGPGPKLEFVRGGSCGTLLGDTRSWFANHTIELGSHCFKISTIQHETMHALGFGHTQSRPDRADYMNYYQENVYPSEQTFYQFRTFDWIKFDNHSIPYEYNSVMHYPSIMGSHDNKSPVLVPKNLDYIASVGGDHGPTFNDWKAINIRYKCFAKCTETVCQNKGYPDPHDCTRCVCPIFYTGRLCEEEKNVMEMSGEQKLNRSYSNLNASFTSNEKQNVDFSQYHKEITVFKAPEGRQIRVSMKKLESDDKFNCLRECTRTAVEIVDEDLSLVGKRFCCENRTGHSIISKSNVVGLQFYSSPGYNLSATVVCELVPLNETTTGEGPLTTVSLTNPTTTTYPANESATPADNDTSTADHSTSPSEGTEATEAPESSSIHHSTGEPSTEESTTAAATEGTVEPESTETLPVSTVVSSTIEPTTENPSTPEARSSYPWSESTTTYPEYEYSTTTTLPLSPQSKIREILDSIKSLLSEISAKIDRLTDLVRW